jgi:hypothetical protein
MDATIQCPSSRGCGVWRMLGEGGVELFLCGHIHYYARDLPEWPVGNNGTGDVVRLTRTTLRPPAAPATATLTTLKPGPTRAPRP